MEEDVEVIFESWVLKLTGLDGRSAFRLSSQWKKRYLILIRQHESASLLYYNQKPSNLSATPKGMVVLEPYYHVEKRQNVRGQQFVVSLSTPNKRLVVAVDDERLFHLLAFFLQVQVKLNEDVEDECFVVRPDNTDDQRKIGARGNMCLLHISPCGLTVALQLSKCVIVQWPLTCIRNYESTARGQFIITVGKRASMGVGHYVFNTRLGQDNAAYDRLDRYVQDAAELKHSHADNISQTSLVEQEHLHSLTYVQANPQFSNHLRKISRDIYDSLWQHLGSTRLKASSPDLVSDSPHVRQREFSRTGSMATLDGAGSVPSVPTTPRQSLRRKFNQPNTSVMSSLASPEDFSSLPRNFHRTPLLQSSKRGEKKKRVPTEMIESTYLHPDDAFNEDNYENDTMMYQVEDPAIPTGTAAMAYIAGIPPDMAGSPITGKPPLGATVGKSPQTARSPQKSKSPEPARSPFATPESSHHGSTSSEPPLSPAIMWPVVRPRLHRLQSRSCEDLTTYMEMGSVGDRIGKEYIHSNGDVKRVSNPDNGGMYSYATQDEVEQTRAAAQRLALRRASGSQNSYLTRDPIPTGFIRKSLVRKQSMKKAMSNPSLIDLEQRHLESISGPRASLLLSAQATHQQALSYPYHKGEGRTKNSGSDASPTSPSGTSQQGSPPPFMTSPVLTSPLKLKMTALAGSGGGTSPFTNRARGIPSTSPSKVFRKPKYDIQGSTKKIVTQQWSAGSDGDQGSWRPESISGRYTSSGGGVPTGNPEMRETHC